MQRNIKCKAFMIKLSTIPMPDEEVAFVTQAYEAGSVILEYGSGQTTRIAAKMPGKLVFSVETDLIWAMELQRELDEAGTASPVIVYHTHIGETVQWGRPVLTEDSWRLFHKTALDIWDEPFFREPDVVLIDGRLRMGCLATVMMYTKKPVTVLFDDYDDRPMYQIVERLIKPVRVVGRMAQFDVVPDMIDKSDAGFMISLFSTMSLSGTKIEFYKDRVFPWQTADEVAPAPDAEE
jgi:hypothetical protein